MAYTLFHIIEDLPEVERKYNCLICNRKVAFALSICDRCGQHIRAGDFNVVNNTTNKKNITSYKIRRKSDGLYSTGGATPNFTKKGKSWSGIGALKNHLNVIKDYSYGSRINKVYTDCEIVAYKENITQLPLEGNMNDLLREFST